MASTQIQPAVVPAVSYAGVQGAHFRNAIRALLAISAVSLIVYRQVLMKLVQDWWTDPNYSYGFVMPLFAAFVIWRMRHELLALELRPRWFGLTVCVAAMATFVVGVLGAELFLSRFSMLVLLAGIVLLFLGAEHLRKVTFAWSMLMLMIPIPVILLNQITFPLQLLASRLATALLSVVGVPVLRDGNVIQLPSTSLEVVAACSGIRSLMSLIALAAIYGYLKQNRNWQRWVLVFLAIPIAVVANSVRIMGTGLLAQYWDPDKAEGFFHLFEGWVIFVLSLCLLASADKLLSQISRARKEHA
jgi:exosortase